MKTLSDTPLLVLLINMEFHNTLYAMERQYKWDKEQSSKRTFEGMISKHMSQHQEDEMKIGEETMVSPLS